MPPLYEYFCTKCSVEYEKFHLMKEDMTGEQCDNCPGKLSRKYSLINEKKIESNLRTPKVGDTVKEFIKTSSKELKEEKKKLKERKK